MYAHTTAKVGEDMYVIGNGYGKSQNRRDHQYRGIHIHLRKACDAIGSEETAYYGDDWSDDTTQRASHEKHHHHADHRCNHHQSPHFLAYIYGLAMCYVGHTCAFRVQRCVFRFVYDAFHLFACDDIRCHSTCLLPYAILWECPQFNHNP